MRRSALAAWSVKEFRALLPLWLACVIAVAVGDRLSGFFLQMLAVLAYGFGSIALGAQSIGHEYSHETLGLLLSQPTDRRRLLLVKFAVLAALLGTLWVAAALTLFDDRPLQPMPGRTASLIALGALFLAPALTMLARSGIAGIVFTIALPGILALGVTFVGMARFGAVNAGQVDRFVDAVFWPGMYAICGVAAVATWWMFGRLQVVEGRGSDIHLALRWLVRPVRSTNRSARPGGLRQLIAKELHLHQMPLVLAGLYTAGILAAAGLRTLNPDISMDPALLMTVLYVLATAALLGSFAIAEERQLGTHEWQLLMPISARTQFGVKVGVAFALVGVLSMGIPFALLPVMPSMVRPLTRDWEALVMIVAVLTAACLYVSSISTSGVRALLVALPALFGAQWVILRLDYWIASVFHMRFGPVVYGRVPDWVTVLFVVATVCVPLVLMAYRNHRSGERSRERVALQLVMLLAIVAAALVAARLLRL